MLIVLYWQSGNHSRNVLLRQKLTTLLKANSTYRSHHIDEEGYLMIQPVWFVYDKESGIIGVFM